MRTNKAILAVGAAAAITGCGGSNNASLTSPGYGTDIRQDPIVQQTVQDATKALAEGGSSKVTEGLNQFGFDLLRKLSKKSNACISPVSVGTVLAMIYNGASGETQKGMAEVLHLQKLPMDQVNEASKHLSDVLSNFDPQKVKLDIANSMWAQAGTPFNPDYLKRTQDSYSAKVSTLDLHAPEAPSTINSWVKESTKGRIPSIVDKIPDSARLFVINAVYFKGLWRDPFDKSRTSDKPFNLSDGTTKQVPMMAKTASYGYLFLPDVAGATVPYGSGRLEMVLLMPNGKNELADLEKALSRESWAKWMKAMTTRQVALTMPRFKSEFDISLNEPLKAMGMATAFDANKADFSGMMAKDAGVAAGQKLFLSEVKHKTYIDVNEEGTEAAAVTSGQMQASAIMVPANITFDRPFIYAVRDSQTGVILFLGRVLDPSFQGKTSDGDSDAKGQKTK